MIKILLPKAEVIDDMFDEQKETHHLGIMDYSEQSFNFQKDWRKFKMMDMLAIKAVNGTYSNLKPLAWKQKFGISKEDKVLSVYFRELYRFKKMWADNDVDFMMESFVRPVFSSLHPDIVFWNAGMELSHLNSDLFAEVKKEGYEVLQLSTLPLGSLSDDDKGKLFIFNDTLGSIPYVLAVSDIAFTAGQVNYIEPLFAEVPSVYIRGRTLSHSDYDQNFLYYLNTLREASDFTVIDHLDEAPAAIENAADIPITDENNKTFYDLDYIFQKDLFNNFMNQLEQSILPGNYSSVERDFSIR